MMDFDFESVTLTLDNDKVLECDVYATFEVDSRQYIVLIPVDGSGEFEPGDTYLYRLVDNGEDEEPGIENITDDGEFELASKAYTDWMESEAFGDIDLDDIDD